MPLQNMSSLTGMLAETVTDVEFVWSESSLAPYQEDAT